MKSVRSNALLFYSGTLVSSIGTLTLPICMAAFMIQSGYDLLSASFIIAFQRLVPTVALALWGQYSDKLPAKTTVVASEFFAAICSIGVIWAWSQGPSHYWFLFGFSVLRSSVVNFTIGSRTKITKLLSDNSFGSDAKNAMWFNKATQGATFFSGAIAWLIIAKFNFMTAVLFDASTYIINGLLLLNVEAKDDRVEGGQEKDSVFKKFTDFYKYNFRAALFDLLLAIAMMGTTSFLIRLAGNDQKWSALFWGAYGLSVWLASFLERSQIFKKHSESIWISLGLSYVAIGMFPHAQWLTFVLCIWKDTSFWLLFHRISSYIQHDTPTKLMGSVTSARMTQMVLIIALGELAVGAWQHAVSIEYEGLIRAAVCFVIVGLLFFRYSARVVQDERPRL